ncbi:MAG TPA: DUF4386 domain-containing protein [Thermoanaerobaculia bacterium]|nr:DUF4386 domain-containing protein [Thermoanaerobaculia bacterium]
MTNPRTKARLAGLFYLLMFPIGGYHQFVAANQLRPARDAALTAANILGHPFLFQSASIVDVLVVACYLVVTALFYELFAPVDGTLSLIAALFSLTGCVTQAFASLFHIAPLLVLRSAANKQAAETIAYVLLKLYSPAYAIGLVFFAFYLIFIGRLIYTSTFMPRILGALVAIQGVAWMTIVWPPLATKIFPFLMLLAAAGEGALMVWLLVKGVKVEA